MIAKTLVLGTASLLSAACFAATGPAKFNCLVWNQQAGKLVADKTLTLNVVQMDQPIYSSPATGLSYTASLTAFGDDNVAPKTDLVFLSVLKNGVTTAQASIDLPLGSFVNLMVTADPENETMTCSIKN